MLRRAGRSREDFPTVKITRAIDESNRELAQEVRKLMLKHERELRLGIRKILVQHGEGCDQPTPLEAPLYRHDSLSQVGPDGNALDTQAIEEQSLSNVLQSLVKELNSGQADVASAAAAPAGELLGRLEARG